MTTAGLVTGVAATAFAPYQDPPTPTPVAGEPERVFADPVGQLMIRGPVLTDEGGFREMFGTDPFAAAPWSNVLTSGTRAVAAGIATFTSGVVVAGRNYVSRQVDILPLIVNLDLLSAARPGGTAEFFWGLYSNPDPDVAIATGEFCECSWIASGAVNAGLIRGGVAGNFQAPASFTISASNAAGFRTLTLDGEGAVYRDGSTTLPTVTTRSTISTKVPDLNTPLYFIMGFRNGAAPINWSVTCSCIFVKNTNRLLVNTGFLCVQGWSWMVVRLSWNHPFLLGGTLLVPVEGMTPKLCLQKVKMALENP